MPSDPLVLAFDTSAAHCAAALLCGETVLAEMHENMGRGQAERLFPLLEDLLRAAGKGWSDLDRIGVGIGPGNFTGIRISVSAARGLALALGIPAIGVNSFDAIEATATTTGTACVPGPRGQAYLRAPESGEPYLANAETLAGRAQDVPLLTPQPDLIALGIARVAASRPAVAHTPPAPLYIKPADAAPSRDAPPVILDDA
ncbi:tRNA (adenosine(37)-N6)-threonylcarbamoyltransferase complex dimerization subunit type 1 TsaB [Mesobacterium sp. TK19101]|uniref:tRNA (Adenosine(37)-N6)-threonylcarbamoyltransferase complex dimerization subunit type 1 TsaB n=1 Tax=Mesobacterium hydrothermale TaxID=3111907 RepID=A0ABU6HEM2_9RHOB|nr:tRNA (adenosine(37)-N6)-threonylcarbamoyltransferase complex dimerization subunit type 1 TsaB [Mesobacterium sp. TK19101]MEC3860902.1 tRNA (adenosine(37)-N6)-threonylcarbamoyltransferase complex dimerization subunit type 1 TsaB [Mesobacterium sp. TK19101]